jgi:riboflavin kinase/FMN adenylyltransferase
MRIIRDFEHCPQSEKGAVVALGNFDGLHLGHQAIIQACIEEAKKLGVKPAVLTFEPHPREFFARDHQPLRILTLRRKLRLLTQMGIKTVFMVRFNKKLAATSAEDFVGELLHRQIGARHIVTGYNFAFGKNREGDVTFLEASAKKLGMGFSRVSEIKTPEGRAISSSAIRTLLALGKMPEAASLLGHPYSIGGRVRSGDARGRKLGFPTANIWLKTLFRPRFGIYAARVKFANGSTHDAVASLGIRPMFVLDRPMLEVHCFDLSRMFYGEVIDVELLEYIREEQKFDTTELLRGQMAQDCDAAKAILKKKAQHG